MTSEFVGKRVLVTGGAKGLGKAIVERFYHAGATVVVLDKDAKALEDLAKELPKVVAHQTDLLNWEATKQTVAKVSPIHHLVNNAGVMLPGKLMDVTMENFDLTFGVNVKAAVNVTQAVVKCNGGVGGTIVNISSFADTKTMIGGVSYNCSKAAMTMLTKNMACELGPAFRVNAVRPTAMVTDMLISVSTTHPELVADAAHLRDRMIIKDRVEVTDCADLVYFLSSSQSRKITGQAIAIDGGMGIN